LTRETDTARADIVQFWRTVEMFSPQEVKKASREQQIFTVQPGRPLPWEADHELAQWKLRPNQAWRHVVYLGIYRLDEVFEVLSRVFTPDKNSYDERPAGQSAIAAFLVGEDGRALLDSEVLSSCAWATGQVLRDGHAGSDWLSQFQDATMDFSHEWRDLVTDEVSTPQGDAPPQYVPRLLDSDDLADCLTIAVAVAGTDTALWATEIRIQSQVVARRTADKPAGVEFLNSFIMGDLNLVAEQTAKGDIGAALREYLRPAADIPSARRIDVRTQLDAVLAATAPETVPAGRWPSDPEHALACNQQLAVNTALGMTTAGILGVNGPPGTGKTTMLRDLIAGLVVERAHRLAALTNPAQAFTRRQRGWVTGQYTREVSVWRRELTGFEMVVASANNGAVQNVTDEIPAADAIDETWQEAAAALDYFPEIATGLLTPEPDTAKEASVSPGWGLVAARLGNKANRSRFVTTFWYHRPDDPKAEDAWWGLLEVLKDYERTGPDRPWSAAVAEFRAVEARVEALRGERSEVYRAVGRRAEMDGELAALRRAVSTAVQKVDAARGREQAARATEQEQVAVAERIALARQAEAEQAARLRTATAQQALQARRSDAQLIVAGRRANAEQAVRSWEAEVTRRWQANAEHQQSRPGLWERLRTLGEASRRWSRKEEWLANAVNNARSDLRVAHQELNAAQQEADAAHRAAEAAQQELDAADRVLAVGIPLPRVDHEPLVATRRTVALAEQSLTDAIRAQAETERTLHAGETELAALDTQLDTAATSLGQHYPDGAWWDDRHRRELAALWTDVAWNQARSELFLAALALHKAFLRHTARDMRRNLQAAMDVVSGEAPRDAPDTAVLTAWQSLFFVVPVVSTTFASYARLFGHLGKEALGWLLIDEAGQATPQNAVGALWRTQRAVVVGDPLQLEPITTLPFRAEQAIRVEAEVDEQWLTSRTSVQRLADRLTRLGTWLSGDEDPTWVGVPLTVHRRCDQPMFDIVNTIAYDGLMIDGTGTSARERFNTAYPALPESMWIDVPGVGAQGHWIPAEGVQLDRILDRIASLEFDMSEVMVIGPFRDVARQVRRRSQRHPGLVAGTVHTAQGKQADIVVLVLGSAPDRPGARNWASSKPNLLNVAVSRAKRRLYVIGDRRAWSNCRYFTVLATDLPHHTPVQS
jgi:hypothetical protein